MARTNEELRDIEARNTLAQLLHNKDAAKRALSRYRRTLGSLIAAILVGLDNIFWGYFTYPDVDPDKMYTVKEYGSDVANPILHDGLSVGLLVTGYVITVGAVIAAVLYVIRNFDANLVEKVHNAQLRYDQQLNRSV
jgi:hypothetical protein